MIARPLVLLPLALAAACAGGDDGDPVDTDAGPSPLVGAWRVDDGAIFDDLDIGDVGYLAFEADAGRDAGFLVLHASDPGTNALDCPQQIWSLGAGGVLLLSVDGGEGGAGAVVFLVDETDPDTLVVRDTSGRSATLTRVEAVPAEATCGAVAVDDATSFELTPDSWGNLLWDGARLLVPVEAGGVVPLDLDAGTYGSPLDFGGPYEHLQVMQGADGWGHCACGGDEEIGRVAVGGATVDAVSTRDLGVELSVRAAAIDDEALLVVGFNYDDRETHVLRVNTAAEPDVLESDVVSSLPRDAVAWHDGGLLLVRDQRILRMAADGTAEATWRLPPAYGDVWWRQIASDGTHVYLGGRPADGVGHLVLTLTLE